MNFKVDIAVCGRFHFHKYLKYINQFHLLNFFFCSYKLNSDFGVERKRIKNYFLKEYLMYFNIRYFKSWNLKKNIIFFHRLWEGQVVRTKTDADLLHLMIHGNGLNIIKKYKSQGKIVIGEAVNAYPQEQFELMQKEYSKYGLQYKENKNERILEEFRLCDHILVASDFVRNSFLNHGFDDNKIISIPYGIDDFVSQKKEQKKSEVFKIVCVGQITFRKGQAYLLEAITALKKKNIAVELTLVGYLDPQYKPYINLEGHTHISHINNQEIVKFMEGFDLFVLPSIEDGFSVAVTEALSAGLPVITTKTNGSSDLIEDYDNGFVVNPYSSVEIEESILKAMNTKFTFVKTPPTWKEYSQKLSEKYKEILTK